MVSDRSHTVFYPTTLTRPLEDITPAAPLPADIVKPEQCGVNPYI